MTSHELASALLEQPDVPVQIVAVHTERFVEVGLCELDDEGKVVLLWTTVEAAAFARAAEKRR